MRSLWALRIVLVLHCALVCAQPILAGYFLTGEADAMSWHGPIGSSLWMLAMLQVLAAALYWLANRGRRYQPLLWSLGLLAAEFTQLIFGYLQNFAVHVPLGTAIVAVVIWMTIWSFRQEVKE